MSGELGRADDPGPTSELMVSSTDSPAAEERLRAALSPWVRRHRLLLGGLGLVAVVAAGAIGFAVTRPPPVDPVIHLSVVGFSSGPSGDIDEQGRYRLSQTLQVTAAASGGVNAVIGVVGPGLTDPTSSMADVTYGLPGLGDLGATVDCEDPGWWEAGDADFQVQVRRTDQDGRLIVGDVPLGDSPLGPSNTFWHNLVRRVCLDMYFRSLPPATAGTVTTADDGHQVDITVTLTNPGDHTIQVLPAEFAAEAAVLDGPLTTVPAGGTASVTVSAVCASSDGSPPSVPNTRREDRTPTPDRGLPMRLYVVGPRNDEGQGFGWSLLDPAFADQVDAELAALCGHPGG